MLVLVVAPWMTIKHSNDGSTPASRMTIGHKNDGSTPASRMTIGHKNDGRTRCLKIIEHKATRNEGEVRHHRAS